MFDLPKELLATLEYKDQSGRPIAEPTPEARETPNEPSEKADGEDGGASKATSCNLCALNFSSVAEQRKHVRSDLHGYNLKQKIKGQKPVGEVEFEKLIGELDESLSGSESSESDEDDEDENGKPKDSTLSALLKKQAKISDPEFDEFASRKKQRGPGNAPLLWFKSPELPENTSLGIYRAILTNAEQEEESHIVDTIRSKQLAPKQPPKIKASDGGVGDTGLDWFGQGKPYVQYRGCSCYPRGVL